MQYPILAQRYKFVPPHPGRMWPSAFAPLLPWAAWWRAGVRNTVFHGADHLRQSIAAGNGILLCPNHPRSGDPIQLGLLSREVRRPFNYMAAWYLFLRAGVVGRWMLRRFGAFSVHREGLDREALRTAISILTEGRRPLVLFPEGVVTRLNDRVTSLLDGVAFIARSAARQNTRPVVIHPVAIKYQFRGDANRTASELLAALETRLTWQPRHHDRLIDRVYRVSRAIMALKEIEVFGATQEGPLPDRIKRLIDGIIAPIEREWLGKPGDGSTVERIRRVRAAIVPELTEGELPEAEQARRWQQLAALHMAQAATYYPGDYVAAHPSAERIIETLERFEEDTSGKCRWIAPYEAIVQVGEALPVPSGRSPRDGEDPLLATLRARIQTMLDTVPGTLLPDAAEFQAARPIL